jgi:hypothetical protein
VPVLDIPPKFKKVLEKKETTLVGTILKCVAQLGEDPRHPSLQTHRVQGTKDPKVFEAYVDKKNRVTFHWDGDTIVLRNNCNHDILKRP